MNTIPTVAFDTEYKCWIAYVGDSPDNSRYIGEGRDRAAAVCDYWSQFHGLKNTARILPPDDYRDHWMLYDGRSAYIFETKEEAAAYGEAREYLISGGAK